MCSGGSSLTGANMVGLACLFFAVAGAVGALIIDQLTAGTDFDITCGWQAASCDEDCGFWSGDVDYKDFCDLGLDDYCDTEVAGQWWLWASIAGIVLCAGNFLLVVLKLKRAGAAAGFAACLAFAAALVVWAGLDEDFDFEGNPVCYDGDDLDDGDIFPGNSMWIMMGCALCALLGAVLSCAA